MQYLFYGLILLAGYLIGSINTSIIVSKILGSDIRNHGSGNAGATNTLRTFGKGAAILVLIFDVLKAAIAVMIGSLLDSQGCYPLGKIAAATGAILGHNFPVYFGFRGGKGILVSITVIFFMDYKIGLIILLVSIAIMAITKYVSLGSIIGSIMFPVLVAVFHFLVYNSEPLYFGIYFAFSVFAGGLAVFMHRSNIKKLLKGTESKLGHKSTSK